MSATSGKSLLEITKDASATALDRAEAKPPVPSPLAGINKNHPSRVIALALIDEHEDNPRGSVDERESSFAELTASMKADGLLEPLVATPLENGRYRLIGGHRRRCAAVRLGWTEIGCTLIGNLSLSQQIALMLSENIHRRELSFCQEARGFQRLKSQGRSVNEIARACQVSQSYVKDRLPLNKLIAEVQAMVDAGDLTLGAGNRLAGLPPEKQIIYAVRAQRLSVRNLDKLIGDILDPDQPAAAGDKKRRARRAAHYRVLTTEEQYTRSTVVGYLNQTPVESFSVREVMDSLDDVCQDACIEEKSELICRSCPVPRLIASLLKRAGAINCHDETAGRETAGRETAGREIAGNARR